MDNKLLESNKGREPNKLKILLRLLTFVIILMAILFIAAGRWDWVMGWLYMAMYASMTVIALLVIPIDPDLVEERTHMKEDVKDWDKYISSFGSLLYPLTILIVAGLDARNGWSPHIQPTFQIAFLLIAALGNLTSIWATSVNKFYSRFVRIQKERGHFAISDGPYRYIRHPGYLGQIIFSLASAIALGSFWALIPGVLFDALLVVRTALEDRVLQDELKGYKEYTQKVHYRLMPYIW
jgi:protein-S-isoprenylcysteine O-methyltransferase Ste14